MGIPVKFAVNLLALDDPGGYLITLPEQLCVWAIDGTFRLPLAIGLLLLLLSGSALSSAAEVAFFSLTPARLNEAPETLSREALIRLLDRPKTLLATVLLLNTLMNIGIILTADGLLRDALPADWPAGVSVLLRVAAIGGLILLFGDVIPKVYARRSALRFSLLISLPMTLAVRIVRPFTWPLTRFSSLLDKRIRRRSKTLSMEELSDVLELTSEKTTDTENQKILKGIVRFGALDVTAIMTPRSDVAMIDIDTPFDEVLLAITENGYSRMPVFRDNGDRIEGILFIKDILPYLGESATFAWTRLIRKPFFVPPSKKIDDLLTEFQSKKVHMALVVDEFGGFGGLVTLEDVIEEIVGEINDEYDDDDVDYYRMNEANYIFAGKTSVQDFLRILDFERNFFDGFENEPESVAGILLELFGKIPARNETVAYKNLTFRILNADNRRINRVKVSIMSENTDPGTRPGGTGLTLSAVVLMASAFLFSCGNGKELIARPKGYCIVSFPKKEYRLYDSLCPFTFDYPVYANIEPFRRDPSKTCWFDVTFPRYHATLHMSYENVSGDFAKFSEDQHTLAYKHTSKANAITEILLDDPGHKLWGIVYDIEGDAASNYQFHVTDSQAHFLRGSLYFDFKANADSVAPVLNFLEKDVMHLAESVRWK